MQPVLPLGAAGAAYPGTIGHGGTAPWTYQITSGALPGGLTVTAAAGSAAFSGTAAAEGTFAFGLRVTDGAGCIGTGNFQIVVAGAVRLEPNALPNPTLARGYEYPLAMWAGTTQLGIVNIALVAGTIPPGLSVSTSGGMWRIAGVPSSTGQFDFTLEGTGGAGYTARQRYLVTVTGGNGVVATPASVRHTMRLGETAYILQRLEITTVEGANRRCRVTLNASGFQLLNGSLVEGVTPFGMDLLLVPANNLSGQFTGSVVITPLDGLTPAVTVPVEFNVQPPPGLILSESTLTVAMRADDPPVTRTVQVLSSDLPLQFLVESLTPIGGNWLAVTPFNGTTPGTLTLTFNPTGMAPGTYPGTMRIAATRATAPAVGSPQTIGLTLVVNPGGTGGNFATAPSSLQFTAVAGGAQTGGQQLQITHTGGAVNWQASSNVSWINLTQSTGTTPSILQVFVVPQFLSVGTHTGLVKFTSVLGEITVPVTVAVSVAPPPGDPTIRVVLDNVEGSVTAASPQTSWTVRVESPVNQTLEVRADPTVDWLTITPPVTGKTPLQFQIVADASKLGTGQYQGAVVIATTNETGIRTSTVVNVKLGVGQGPSPGPSELTLSRPVMVFDHRVGEGLPAVQTMRLAAGGPLPVLWTATPTVTWVNLSQRQGTTPTELEISVSPQLLGPGNYRGEIRFSRGTETVAVATLVLTVRGAGTIAARPGALIYDVETGRAPGAQLLEIFRPGSAVAAEFTVMKTPDWLVVTPRGGQTPSRLEARLVVDKLPQAGATEVRVEGTIDIESNTGALRVPVIVTVKPFQAGTPGGDGPWILSVTNSATTETGAVAPGELVTLYGGFKGSAVDVFFDSIRGTVLYRDENQMNAIVPFGIAGRAGVRVRVEADGKTSRELELGVADTAPGIYTVNGSGRGYAAALNQDGTRNWEMPAERGSVVVVYVTGLGVTDPPGVDGALVRGAPLPAPRARVEATIGGKSAIVEFCGTPVGFVHGAVQCNLRVAADAAFAGGSGDAEIVLRVGGASSPAGVRVRLR